MYIHITHHKAGLIALNVRIQGGSKAQPPKDLGCQQWTRLHQWDKEQYNFGHCGIMWRAHAWERRGITVCKGLTLTRTLQPMQCTSVLLFLLSSAVWLLSLLCAPLLLSVRC
jgi:hypothetical protein